MQRLDLAILFNQSITAFAGGSSYRLTTWLTFSTSWGSSMSLKVLVRRGSG
jgi:hypothetical protein